MFKFQEVTPEMKSAIFGETSMLITKCEKPNNLIYPLKIASQSSAIQRCSKIIEG
jgi:hypothetical protein